eukprot:751856-Hanusia_phi.AAC.3
MESSQQAELPRMVPTSCKPKGQSPINEWEGTGGGRRGEGLALVLFVGEERKREEEEERRSSSAALQTLRFDSMTCQGAGGIGGPGGARSD